MVSIHKNNWLAAIDTRHFRDRTLSLAAKGLLSFILTLEDDEDDIEITSQFLKFYCKEPEATIEKLLLELSDHAYIEKEG